MQNITARVNSKKGFVDVNSHDVSSCSVEIETISIGVENRKFKLNIDQSTLALGTDPDHLVASQRKESNGT